MKLSSRAVLLLAVMLLTACQPSQLNNPYSEAENGQGILYQSFSERPKHLDPATAYSSNEYAFIGQIYEPPLQYHYLKRPYELAPLTAAQLPEIVYLDKNGKSLPNNATEGEVIGVAGQDVEAPFGSLALEVHLGRA